jgi:hypothetical protein
MADASAPGSFVALRLVGFTAFPALRPTVCPRLFDELVVVTDSPRRVEAGVEGHGGLEIRMSEQLLHQLKGAWFGIEQKLPSDVAHLMRGHRESEMLARCRREQVGDGGWQLLPSPDIDEDRIVPLAGKLGAQCCPDRS